MAEIRLTNQDKTITLQRVEPTITLEQTGARGPAGIGIKGDDGADGLIQSIVAGENITVDNTDPANPVVSGSAGGMGIELGKINILPLNGGYTQTVTGNGSVSATSGRLLLSIPSGVSYAGAKSFNMNRLNQTYGSWWDYDYKYSCMFGFTPSVGTSIIFGLGQDNWTSTNLFAPFRGVYAELIAGTSGASSLKTLTMKNGTANAEIQTNAVNTLSGGFLMTIHKHDDMVDFYYNGVLVATHTTFIMSSADFFSQTTHIPTYVAITNNGTGATVYADIPYAETVFYSGT